MGHEGFVFRDVTDLSGEAKWGSYMEDPLPGARFDVLQPMWISGQALERVEKGIIPKLNETAPPLLIFHADQGRSRAHREQKKIEWEEVVMAFLKSDGRKDFNEQN